jgi:K+-sensing histidine kinase KdpD
VVVLSACDDPLLAREAVRLGAQDFLVKSEVTVHSLTRAAQYAVDRVDLLKAASHSKQFSNEFLRTVSHDLRAPLARLAQLTEILREDYGDVLTSNDAQKLLDGIEDESRYLAHFVQHLYSFCKQDESRRALQLEPISLLVPLVRTLDILGSEIDQHQGRICIGRMPILFVDSTLIAHVFQNLIGNALKYSGGRRPKITVEAVCHPAKCVVTVSDNGLGVSEEELDRVFEPFYRSQYAAVLDGNGVGLAFCKKVITCHGGRIWASSSKSGGCIISFTLPLEQVPSADII